ncbi:DUF952 domain-containing protein [Phormidesmis sp. 146-33]
MSLIFHITSQDQWQQAQQQGFYRCDSLETEGFIHCSELQQVVWVANRFYRSELSLVLLCIEIDKVQSEIKYELVEEDKWFPHLYGVLNLDAIVEVVNFVPGSDGLFELPAGLQS